MKKNPFRISAKCLKAGKKILFSWRNRARLKCVKSWKKILLSDFDPKISTRKFRPKNRRNFWLQNRHFKVQITQNGAVWRPFFGGGGRSTTKKQAGRQPAHRSACLLKTQKKSYFWRSPSRSLNTLKLKKNPISVFWSKKQKKILLNPFFEKIKKILSKKNKSFFVSL